MLVDRTRENAAAETLAILRPKSTLPVALLRFCAQQPLGAFGAAVLIFAVVVAVLAPMLAPHSPTAIEVAEKFTPPFGKQILGTDELGRDVLSRLIFGARISMSVSLLSVGIAISAGTLIGIFSAYSGGKTDLAIQRLVDTMMAFPAIIMALALMAALGASQTNVIVALVVILLPGAVRVVRSQVLSIKEQDYTLAARAIGAGSTRIMLRHILPNVMATYIVLSTITLGYAIVVEASLSFLGVGIPPDIASWGGMLNLGATTYIDVSPWLSVFPGITIAVIVFSVNLLGDSLRDVLDPRLRGR
ncbi:MAG: ABC transporter permease [Chloroflexi bacterium]|nr:MAG: ABC transporter permease [Chloroflexota bacterium]|tara:strand:- start:4467 stop:5375 length:909 start_codon:yes stop_codon:yes gene_type:complete